MKNENYFFLLFLLLSIFGCIVPEQKPPVPVALPAAVPAEQGEPTPAIPEFIDRPQGIPPMGYNPDPEATKEFLQSLEKPTIREAGPELFNKPQAFYGEPKTGDDEPVLLYRALVEVYQEKYGKPWKTETQKIGDCVSHGWAHGVAASAAVKYQLGEISEWQMPATEAIYGGSRVEARGSPGDGARAYGGYSDGSYGAAAAKWVNARGGILFRKQYEKFDLSVYSGDRAKEWGAFGCGGKNDGEVADRIAKDHQCQNVALVRSFTEAAAAIKSGYAVPVCSMQGFSSRRDSQGFASPSGSWAHCMCFVGVRFDRPGLLCLNSWGDNWITGPVWPDDQIPGSFWVDAAVATRMLDDGDSFAVSTVGGFEFRDLDNAAWLSSATLPKFQYAAKIHKANLPR